MTDFKDKSMADFKWRDDACQKHIENKSVRSSISEWSTLCKLIDEIKDYYDKDATDERVNINIFMLELLSKYKIQKK